MNVTPILDNKMLLKQRHMQSIVLCAVFLMCDAVSPFKNHGNGIGSGVMINAANPPPNLFTPMLSSHGQGGIRPQALIFADKFGDKDSQYATAVPNYTPSHYYPNKIHGHYPTQHHVHRPRQFRNPFDVVFEWRQIDFEYDTFLDRQRAILNGDFIPTNVMPLGLDRWRNRLFVTLPRWKSGVPASLTTLSLPAIDRSPALRPYPSWDWHSNPEALRPDCSRLMSVYRVAVDECDRLWVLDTGIVNATTQANAVCPPKLLVFDLRTDQPIFSYELPPDQVKEDSFYTNLVVDIRNGRCNDAHAYLADVFRYGITVFSLAKGRSWRTQHHFFIPNPEACDYTLSGLNFQWSDGVFGLSLSPVNNPPDRFLFFHPMSSYAEFVVSTSVLRNESAWTLSNGSGQSSSFIKIGERGNRGQSSTVGIDRNNVQFYTLVQQNAVGCWNSDEPYFQDSIDIVAQDNTTLVFPNDLKIDREIDQGVWVLSNRLPVFLYSQLDFTDINFRIQRASTRDAVLGTACDSNILKQPLHTLAMP